MSQSQASDSLYEGSYYDESIINPSLLRSDPSDHECPDLPSSDITRASVSLSNTWATPIKPKPKPQAPTSLRRVGKPLQQVYVLYNEDNEDTEMQASRNEFVQWWLKTDYGQQSSLRKSIKWDSELKKSDVWPSFDQVAHERTGEPKVMCTRCQNVIIHPGHRRAGCTPMRAHLNSSVCIQPRPLRKKGIDQLVRNLVSIRLYLLLLSHT